MKEDSHRWVFLKNDPTGSGQKQCKSSSKKSSNLLHDSFKKEGCEKTYEIQVFHSGGVSTEKITVESPIQRFEPDFEVTSHEESSDYAIKYDKESCVKDFQKEEKLPNVVKKVGGGNISDRFYLGKYEDPFSLKPKSNNKNHGTLKVIDINYDLKSINSSCER